MNKKEHINKLTEEALESVDGVKRAEAKPFLHTRIQARMNRGTESIWERAGWLIARPAVAFTGLCLIVLINVIVMMNTDTVNNVNGADQVAFNSNDEFSSTVATIYEIENTQP